MQVEFRVRPVTRYIITRHTNQGGSEALGEFDNETFANEVRRVMELEAYWASRQTGETGSGQG